MLYDIHTSTILSMVTLTMYTYICEHHTYRYITKSDMYHLVSVHHTFVQFVAWPAPSRRDSSRSASDRRRLELCNCPYITCHAIPYHTIPYMCIYIYIHTYSRYRVPLNMHDVYLSIYTYVNICTYVCDIYIYTKVHAHLCLSYTHIKHTTIFQCLTFFV